MNRRKIIAANWKMNLLPDQGDALVDGIRSGLPGELQCEVIIAPPAVYLSRVIEHLAGTPVQVAAQNCHSEENGAFTGEISPMMLAALGVNYCLTGHSERRQIFQETNAFIRDKVDAILRNGMTPVFCCGEPLEIREQSAQNDFVGNQLEESLFHLSPEQMADVVIAYEPIWAIGTGRTASPEQAQEMHAFIRHQLAIRYGQPIADSIRILYGGSVKGDNASELFSQPDVDGGLVGGASLQVQGFLEIIRAGNQ